MAKIVAFVKASYLDKNKGARLYERWRLNTGIKTSNVQVTIWGLTFAGFYKTGWCCIGDTIIWKSGQTAR